ncbi:hypothetical protein L6270_01015 [Candidatus Parcubacteria bacterium]|nr:hypothetical protein [Patescibacteria group bacterium]MBU4309726.1 hypothetical protein [Patescibacteria group bacterium]MBU4432112.1 hypothetical protein [Patescibacteria group bacterium]MBU4577886.1 hypothetical protein [Patescibacteria group bacterium]MCG2696603.1 hypothetical protein [Candidatus Parcubacteria bacterium]
MEPQALNAEVTTNVATSVAEAIQAPAHKHVFNKDFAIIALAVSSVYTYLIVFTLQFLS